MVGFRYGCLFTLLEVQTISAFRIMCNNRIFPIPGRFYAGTASLQTRLSLKAFQTENRSFLKMSIKAEQGNVANRILQGLTVSITGNFGGERDSILKLIKSLGAQDSPTVHKRVDFLVSDEGAIVSQTKHVRKAVKYGVKVVSAKFLYTCAENKAIVDCSRFLYHVKISRSDKECIDD